MFNYKNSKNRFYNSEARGDARMNSLFEYSDKLNAPYECFLFDTSFCGFPIRPHWHYFMEMIFMLEGSAMMTCEKDTYVVEPGDMILFLPQQVHSIYTTTNLPLKYYVLKFDINQLAPSANASGTTFSGIHFNSLFQLAKGDPHAPLYFSSDDLSDCPVERLFSNCIQEMSAQEYGYRIMIQSHINALLTHILRKWRALGFDTDQSLALPDTEDSIHTITEYIDAHAHEAIKVEDLAAICHMSYSYFAKSFRELYGQSCKKYIEFIRLSKAEDLLLFTNLDLNYISQETGFSDCSHFIKAFRGKHGITPKQYRKEHA